MTRPGMRLPAGYPRWKWAYAFAAAAVLAFMVIGNLIRLHDDASIRGPDVIVHLNNSVEFYRRWQDAAHDPAASWHGKCLSLAASFSRPLSSSSRDLRFPNLVFAVTALFYSLFGQAMGVAKASNWVYLLLLLWSVYALGRSLSGRLTGLLAASLVGMYPLIFESFRQYGLDFPLAAMVAFSMALLMKSDGFADRRYSLLLGLAIGVGMLVKLQMVIYLALPLGVLLATSLTQAYRQGGAPLAPRLINFSIASAAAAIVSSIWWAGNLDAICRFLRMHRTVPGIHPVLAHDYGAVAWRILQSMAFDPMGLPLFAASVVAFGCFLAAPVKQRSVWGAWAVSQLVMMPLLIPVSFHGWIPGAHWRFGMPVLPALAVLTSWWVCRLRNSTARAVVFVLLLAFACVQFSVRTFASDHAPPVAAAKVDGPITERLGMARIRMILSDPRELLGTTDFGCPKRQGFLLKLDMLLQQMQPYISPTKKMSVLCLSRLQRPRSAEDILIYLMSNRYANLTAYQMGRLLLPGGRRILEDLDFIIVYSPRPVVSWRDIETDLTQGDEAPALYLPSTQDNPRNLWRSPSGLKLLGQISREIRQFELVFDQPMIFESHWLLYKRRSLRGGGA
ncbi:MAG: glycosyltransferase family 39 protein [Elusimicrobia bacterium]|nr:glycosyltransferase family 39 protein [Elusimicrobiota bacterium]